MTAAVQGCAGYVFNHARTQTNATSGFEQGCAGCAGFHAHARVSEFHTSIKSGKNTSRVDRLFNPAHPAHHVQSKINQGLQPIRVEV